MAAAVASSIISATMTNTGSGLTRKLAGGDEDRDRDAFDEHGDSPRERRRQAAKKKAADKPRNRFSSLSSNNNSNNNYQRGGYAQVDDLDLRDGLGFDEDLEDPPMRSAGSALDEVGSQYSDDPSRPWSPPHTHTQAQSTLPLHTLKRESVVSTTINPLLAGHAEKVKVRVRVVYSESAQRESVTKDVTPQELLSDVTAHEKKTDGGATRIAQTPPLVTSVGSGRTNGNGGNGNNNENVDRRDFIAHATQRDIRRLTTRVSSFSEPPPHLLVRRHAVILSFGSFLRAVVYHDRVVLIAPNEGERVLDMLEKSILDNRAAAAAAKDEDSLVTFEVSVYEALLNFVLAYIKQQYEMCKITTNEIIRSIGNDALLSVSVQEQMRLLKDQVRDLSSRIGGYCQLLTDVLQSDQDEFAFMYLTELARDPFIYNFPVQDGSKILFARSCNIETIMDSLLMDFEELEKATHSLNRKIAATETSVALRLEASRNELLVATTIISIISSTIGFAGFVTGAFGMNLDNSAKFDKVDGLFAWVVTMCIVFVIASSTGVIVYFERSGWLPKNDYWASFKQFQQKASTIVSVVPISQITSFIEEKAEKAASAAEKAAEKAASAIAGTTTNRKKTADPTAGARKKTDSEIEMK